MRIKSADLKNKNNFCSRVLRLSVFPWCRERPQTAICCIEWFGRLKCLATGLDVFLSSFSSSRRCSRNRSPSRPPVSPIYNFLQRVQVIQYMKLAEVQVKWSVILMDRLGFRSNFHASSPSHSNQYLRQIQCAQNSFSRKIMRITIRAMCQKRDGLDKHILQCRSEMSKICPAILVQSIRTKIQEVNSKLFNHLHQIKAHKLEQLTGHSNTRDSSRKPSAFRRREIRPQ